MKMQIISIIVSVALLSLISASNIDNYRYGSYLYVIQNLGDPSLYLGIDINNNIICQKRDVNNFANGQVSNTGSQRFGPGISDRQLWYCPNGGEIRNQATQYFNDEPSYLGHDGVNIPILKKESTNGWYFDYSNTLAWGGSQLRGYVVTLDPHDMKVYMRPVTDSSNNYQKWIKIPFPDPDLLQKSFYIASADDQSLVIQPDMNLQSGLPGRPNSQNQALTYTRTILGKKSNDINCGLFQHWIIKNQNNKNHLQVFLAAAPNVCMDISQSGADSIRDGKSLLAYTNHDASWSKFNSSLFNFKRGKLVSEFSGPWHMTVDASNSLQPGNSVYARPGTSGSYSNWIILPVDIAEILDAKVKMGPYSIESVAYPGSFVTLVSLSSGPYDPNSSMFDVRLLYPQQITIPGALTNVSDASLLQQWYYYPSIQAFKPVVNEAGSLDMMSGHEYLWIYKQHLGWNQHFIYDPDVFSHNGGGIYCPSYSRYWMASRSEGSNGSKIITSDIIPGQQVPNNCKWRIKLISPPISPPLPSPSFIPSLPSCITTTNIPPRNTTTTSFSPPATITSCACAVTSL